MNTGPSEQTNFEAENAVSLISEHKFVPIPINWRKKYYRVSFWKRLGAYLLDSLFFNIIALPIIVITENPLLFTLSGILFILYLAISESSSWKGSLGKLILKIQISDLDGNSISFCRSIFRNFLKTLIFYSYFLIIPLIFQIWSYNKTKKLFHDHLSRTLIGVRLPRNTLKPKIPLNYKLIFQISLVGIVLPIVSIFWPKIFTENILISIFFTNLILIITAYFIAKLSAGRYALHGFLVGLLYAIWGILVQLILIDKVEANMIEASNLANIKMQSSALFIILTGGIFSGLMTGFLLSFYTCIVSEIIKMRLKVSEKDILS